MNGIAFFKSVFVICPIIALLSTAKQAPSGERAAHFLLACLTIVSSWALVHTMFTIRYADMFYSVLDGDPLRVNVINQDVL